MGEVMANIYRDDLFLEKGCDIWMDNQSSALLFEKSKISTLRGERENVQKKTFTKWVNSHLQKVEAHINDLYHDFQDGRQLILLLEILSATKLPRPSKGRMRIHFLENVEHALAFLKKKEVQLTNIGNHDIVDGNPKITLGLIWTIILRFQIQDLMIETDSLEQRSAKDALLLWCQSKVQGYPNVNVTNFTTSWRDGFAFNAIIHKHRPDLIDMKKLVKEEPIKNLNMAFSTAERELGVFPLLDAPDVCVDFPDEKSIMTYVATFYQYFSKMKQVEVSGSRIQNVIKQVVDNENLIKKYECLSEALMEWIQARILILQNHSFGNTLLAVQQQLTEFNLYRTQEKPPKYVDKGNIEVLMFEITSKLRLNHQKMYNPPEALMVNEINKAWQQLEKEEHCCEVALRKELIRQQQLEQLASRFSRKAKLRETWLKENSKLLQMDNFGNDLPSVEASVKKHEAIDTDIKAYESRVVGVFLLCDQLKKENYHKIEFFMQWTNQIKVNWEQLLILLKFRSSRLEKHLQIYKVFQEMIYINDWMNDIKTALQSEDFGKHLVSVEDLLQKHSLLEADISVQSDRVKAANNNADMFLETVLKDEADGYKANIEVIKSNQSDLLRNYTNLCNLSLERKQRLEESLQLHTFYRDLEEEDIWLSEKDYFVSSTEYGHDLCTTAYLLHQHKTLEEELAAKKQQTDVLFNHGNVLIANMPYATARIKELSQKLKEKWKSVDDASKERCKRLKEVLNLHQFFSDCREIEADMNEFEAPVANDDWGQDEQSVGELIRNYEKLHNEVLTLENSIKSVEELRTSSLEKEVQESPEVLNAIDRLKEHFLTLQSKIDIRMKKLNECFALFKLYSEADIVRTWVTENSSQLKTYLKLERSYDLERCTIVQHKFEGFEQELTVYKERMKAVNDMADKILQNDSDASQQYSERIGNLNSMWDSLLHEADAKKKELNACLLIQTIYSEFTETQSWIVEKTGLLASVEDPGADLSSVIALQRRLLSIERDIASLPLKMQDLHSRAVSLSKEYPEEAISIQARFDDMQSAWENLSKMVKEKNEFLLETGELKRFIISLDEFLSWLQHISEACSSEDLPQSVSENESLLDAHFEIKTIIEQHVDDYNLLVSEGPKYIHDDHNDLQTQSLRQQMTDLRDDWTQLHELWHARKILLEQSMNHQLFLRDSKQSEAILGQQELFLSKQRTTPTADALQEEIKKLEEYFNKMATHDDKINHLLIFAEQLCQNNHYAKEKIVEKANCIDECRKKNRDLAENLLAELLQDLQLKQFLEDSSEVIDWMNERLQSASDESYKENTNIRSKLIKHTVFEAELDANKVKMDILKENGQDIIKSNPNSMQVVKERLENIDALWEKLNKTSKEKRMYLTEASRQQQFNAEIVNLDKWIIEIDNQVTDSETGTDIVSARELFDKHKSIESDVSFKKHRMIDLCANPEVDEEKIVAEKRTMEERFQSLEKHLAEKGEILENSLNYYQYKRDVEDAQVWIDEVELTLQSKNFGNRLHDVQRSKKRHLILCNKISCYEPFIVSKIDHGNAMITENHPRSNEIELLKSTLSTKWNCLKDLSNEYQANLDEALVAKQFFFDAAEAESWLSEKELFLIGDDRGKDQEQVQNMIKSHIALENTIAVYADTVVESATTVQGLITRNHPESEAAQLKQTRLEQLYLHIKELVSERRDKLDENLKLFLFQREVQDLESWIADREVIASSQDIGQDYDQVQMLEERFARFSNETRITGKDRLLTVNAVVDLLIAAGHSDSAIISEWKDKLNRLWDCLLELLDTRKELLVAGHEYHRFFHIAKETLSLIDEKEKTITEDLGRDQQSVYTLQRYHKAFESDLKPLGLQVEGIHVFASKLKLSYAGNPHNMIIDKETEVVKAWQNLLQRVSVRGLRLEQSNVYQEWLMQVQDLLLWIQDIRMQIESDDKPKDIPDCDHIMSIHQGRKSEMDTKEEKFNNVFKVANELSEFFYIKEKVENVREKKATLEEEWDVHWEDLQLTSEVMQFAREAHLAEEWIIQNGHFISGKEFDGLSVDEIMKLIEKHSNFEHLLSNQQERFHALERLTTFELRNARQKQVEAAKREKEEKERIERELAEIKQLELEAQRIREQNERTVQEEDILIQEVSVPITESTPLSSPSQVSPHPVVNENDNTNKMNGNEIKMKGLILRKPTKEAQNKKAHQRIWKEYYAILKNYYLFFYKDEQDALQGVNLQSEFNLSESQVEVASDYHKKKYTFRIKLSNGFEYLINAKSVDEMSLWIQNIRGNTIDTSITNEDPRKRLTMINSPQISSIPNQQDEVQKKEKEKKRSSTSLFKIRKAGKP
ncbi:spectrin beta chain, non-erythrocytic 1 isoform X4 [Hydra vulgaris]